MRHGPQPQMARLRRAKHVESSRSGLPSSQKGSQAPHSDPLPASTCRGTGGAIDLLDGVLLGLAQTRGCWGRTRVELFLPCCSPGWWDLATPPVCPFNCNRLVGCKARSLQRNHALAQDRDPGAANEVSTPLAETAQPAARKLCSARAAAQLS